MVFSISQKR